jgi:uncharacterized membrane protein YeiB
MAVPHTRPDLSPSGGERVVGYDVARSLAILGMMVVHFSLVMGAEHDKPAWLAALLGLLDGRAAANFVVLAGIGITLLSRRAVAGGDATDIAGARKTLIRRGAFLLAVGFVNLVIWPGDILRVYGVSLFLAARLITAPGRRLLLGALVFAIGFVILFCALDFEKNWDWVTLSYHGLWTPAGVFKNLFYDGFRSVFPWTGFILFGMWLGRLDIRDRATNTRVLLTAAGVALAAESVSRGLVWYMPSRAHGMDAETVQALFGTESMPALPLFLLAAGGEAVALIALCVRVTTAWPGRLWRPLACTGQMALTWYAAHIILGLGTVVALDLVGTEPLTAAAGCGVVFFVLAVSASWLWRRSWRYGPLEKVLRVLAG